MKTDSERQIEYQQRRREAEDRITIWVSKEVEHGIDVLRGSESRTSWISRAITELTLRQVLGRPFLFSNEEYAEAVLRAQERGISLSSPQPDSRPMTLTNFKVHPNLEIDVYTNSMAVIITADARATQVVAFITREVINDSFPQHHLTNDERIGLVNSNLAVICDIISAKYARGDAHPHHSARSTIPRIDISSEDLQIGPRLSDDYLLMARGAPG